MLLEDLSSDAVLDAAYAWLCRRRRRYPMHADVWGFRCAWPREKPRIQAALLAGEYRFGLLSRMRLRTGEVVDVWSARDAVVLKALAIVLATHLPVSRSCTHVKGHGGAKWAVRQVWAHAAQNQFVLRTDVRDYYASIPHDVVWDQLTAVLPDPRIGSLLGQYLRRTSERGGRFWEFTRGIPLGCSLSPLIGAFVLHALDARLERLGLFYVRFMDDLLVLAPTRWALRRAIRTVNAGLAGLGLTIQPGKTFIGRVAKGFDYLGYHVSPEGLTLAPESLRRFAERAARLYEQGRGTPSGVARLGRYVSRWRRWAKGGLDALPDGCLTLPRSAFA